MKLNCKLMNLRVEDNANVTTRIPQCGLGLAEFLRSSRIFPIVPVQKTTVEIILVTQILQFPSA